ncbi:MULTISPECIES: MarC family protein [Alteromonadaceae]|uniref:MarC family protein n=1 Tax=Alteromonadaceae TaxID=72275 RepID=UPI001C084F76|nr:MULTISPECIES: MarC family protein [Aliiglaciecola]MBU2877953.1 MarC family protein [Aliiglaciecola lipolytica]MDO6709318.1 MarC family protein [Aliiglaciecola sp. 2_MG-2023]MDO6750466.1 MarC family protein [Aliiglaciecola sp. 1_MG-2023]
MMEQTINDFLIIWATVDPIGTMALFAGLTSSLTPAERRKTAFKTIIYSSLVLLGAIVVGQIILTAMGISLLSFKVAGGIILFLFGIKMIFDDNSSRKEMDKDHDMAVFPLAIPATASPGAILAVILLTDNYTHPIEEQITTALVMLSVLLITLVLLLLSGKIIRIIGSGGASILTRIMGMILAALSVEFVIEALSIEKWISSFS